MIKFDDCQSFTEYTNLWMQNDFIIKQLNINLKYTR